MKNLIFFFVFVLSAFASSNLSAQEKLDGYDYERIEISKTDALKLLKQSNNREGYEQVKGDTRTNVRYELVESISPHARRVVNKDCYRPKKTSWGVEIHRVACNTQKKPIRRQRPRN